MLGKLLSSIGPAMQAGVGSSFEGATSGALNAGFNYLGNAITGGPSGPPSGAEQGREARDYLNQKFPGTNSWEQLGGNSASPEGPKSIADRQQKTQRNIADKQFSTQRSNVAAQTQTAKEVAGMKGRETAVNAGAQYGPAAVNNLSKHIVEGTPLDTKGMPKRGHMELAAGELLRKARLSEVQIADIVANPARAALLSEAQSSWRALRGNEDSEKYHWYKDNRQKMLTAGIAATAVDKILKAIPGIGFIIGKGNASTKSKKVRGGGSDNAGSPRANPPSPKTSVSGKKSGGWKPLDEH